jgi:membrane-associated phospholipid phosphatase
MNVLLQAIRSVDIGVYHFLNGYAGNWFLDRVVSHEEAANILKGGLFLALYAYVWFRGGTDQRKRRSEIVAILTGTLLTLAVTRLIADLAPFRVRPMYFPHRPHSFPIALNMENWSSFPSDTAAYFIALAYGLAHLMRRYAGPIMLYTVVWICLPRMYLGEHYLSDILAGAAIGLTVVWIALRSEWLRSGLADRVLAFTDAKPQVFYGIAFLVSFEMGVLFNDVRVASRGLFHLALAEPRRIFLHPALLVCEVIVAGIIAGYLLFRIFMRRPVISGLWHRR